MHHHHACATWDCHFLWRKHSHSVTILFCVRTREQVVLYWLTNAHSLHSARPSVSTALSSTSCLRFVTTTTSSTSLVRVRACSLSNSLGREAPSLLLHHLKLFFCDLILVQDWDLNFTTFVITREQSALNLHNCLKIWHSEVYLGGTLALRVDQAQEAPVVLLRECVLLVHRRSSLR